MNLESLEPISERIVGALLNGGYQGILLTAMIAVALKGFARINAATRHAVWFVTFLLIAVLPAVHFWTSGPEPRAAGDPTSLPESRPNPPVTDASPAAVLSDQSDSSQELPLNLPPTRESAEELNQIEPQADLISLSGLLVRTAPEPGAERTAGANQPRGLFPTLSEAPPDNSRWRPGRSLPSDWRLSLPAKVGILLVTGWLGIAFLRLSGLVGQCCFLHTLKQTAAPASASQRALFSAVSAEMELKRPTRLLSASDATTPMVVGFWRPAVVLPAGMFENVPAAQLEQVIRHELGHVIRFDDWLNLIQQSIRAVLFFHPAVWWISRRLSLEREVACDDHALTATGSPRAYALFLTEFAGRMPGRDLAAAPAAWNQPTQLKERINMILDSNRDASPRLAGIRTGVLATATLMFAGLVLQAAPRVTLETEPLADTNAEIAVVADANVETVVTPEVFVKTAVKVHPPSEPLPVSSTVTLTQALPVQVASNPRPKPRIDGPRVSLQPVSPALPPMPAVAPLGPLARQDNDRKPVPTEDGEQSLERRMNRLERLVERLLAQSKGVASGAMAESRHSSVMHYDANEIAKLAEESRRTAEQYIPSKVEITRIKERAKQDAERGRRDAERASQKARRDQGEGASSSRELEQLEAQRDMLESKRQALEEQVEELKTQMEKLKETKARLKEHAKAQSEKRSDSSSEDSNPNDNVNEQDAPKKKVAN